MKTQQCAIGVDIGGTNIRAALISATGEILSKKVVPGSRDRETAIDIISGLIREIDGPQVVAIGIGVPGRVDAHAGAVLSGGYLDLSSCDFRTLIESAFGKPVAIANDCSMALLGETGVGASRGARSAVMLTIGTGIGGAAMENGRIVNGKQSAGQLGHIVVNHGGRQCICGQVGCVETESSGTALGRHLDEAGYPAGTRFEDILSQARDGDDRALGVIRNWAGPLRAALGTLSAAFDPAMLLLGGGMGQAAVEALAFLPAVSGWNCTPVRAAALGDDAGIVGAGLAAHELARQRQGWPSRQASGKRVLMVNGIPASGKSRLSHAVSEATGWPILALDTVKNPFLEYIEDVDRLFNRTLGKASYKAIWSVIRDAPDGSTFIVDAWFGFQPLELLREHIEMSGATDIAEIWCHAPGEILAERYAARLEKRLPGHPGASYIPELIELAKRAGPSAVGPVYDVDTTQLPDDDAAVRWAKLVLSGMTPAS
ncbi:MULTISPECIES: ROK family protein [unclassified Rhizobium]|uniref:ROK family protein n=1 Tax=unclassified Rhizobium TaxID=2613769 RepID=UPI001ADC1E58|nr:MULTISPECIES: ROK family protein [unclassified Rhizobium]MBO9100639.1 ROK family protein [Rhizobium sp. L58/93]MBO9171311.1 ROK family protein [Rhizobium sp. L245/93]MBO9187178.1 ROK family protein [Rhizobium sp. E27B/91]QXZ87867.1 ROK family protein [Rhizobium sp. K1/93]QXZ93934.1 ROK family protein [Rhizobium sp. K15/93]